MPDQNNQAPGSSPFEIITSAKSKKTGRKGLMIAIVIVAFLILSVIAGVVLVRQRQQITEKAQVIPQCPGAEACPAAGQPGLLRNCHPPESDNSPSESLCNTKGRVEFCGTKNYCCPNAGGAWTADMTACQSPSPSPSPSVSPSPTSSTSPGVSPTPSTTPSGSATPTPTGTKTPTPSSTPKAQTSPLPIPETGTSWPTVFGIGAGAAAILIAILLAL